MRLQTSYLGSTLSLQRILVEKPVRNYTYKTLRIFAPLFAVVAMIVGISALARVSAQAQQPPPEHPPANVAGKWTIYSKSADGNTATKYIDLQQKGNMLSGHFKGPFQSGGLEGTVNGNHIAFRTKTRNVFHFRGRVNGDQIEGTFNTRGMSGTWEARRSD
jgi:hypothetical protein